MEIILVILIIILVVGAIGNIKSGSNRVSSNTNRESLVISHITGEVLRPSEIRNIINDRTPVKIELRLSKYKKDRKLISSINVGDRLSVDYKTWEEGEDEVHHYSVLICTQDRKPLASIGPEHRRNVALKYDHIKSCVVNEITIEPEPKMVVTIEYN